MTRESLKTRAAIPLCVRDERTATSISCEVGLQPWWPGAGTLRVFQLLQLRLIMAGTRAAGNRLHLVAIVALKIDVVRGCAYRLAQMVEHL
jgi:hypothetical protein